MKHPTDYRLLILAASVFLASQLSARPIGFSELSLMVRMHESETSIKNEIAERKLLHGLTQPQEGILKTQGASDSLIQSLRNSNLVASKEEAAAVESAAARESSAPLTKIHPAGHHRHVLVFDVAFGHPINLSQWGGLDYEIAFLFVPLRWRRSHSAGSDRQRWYQNGGKPDHSGWRSERE
jgi:hypothetical protein